MNLSMTGYGAVKSKIVDAALPSLVYFEGWRLSICARSEQEFVAHRSFETLRREYDINTAVVVHTVV
tara:strand:+ start:357 stop:557 length:201 start_codon:yes stop_codon:yes gene_type:complete